MASFNTSNHHSAADVLGTSLAAGGSNAQHNHQQHHFSHHLPPPPSTHPLHHSHHPAQQHYERSSSSSSSTTSTTYLVPVTSSQLPLDSTAFLSASPHFVTSNPVSLSSHSACNTSSSYTFVQIKREPCQVSEVTTSNTNNHHHALGSIAAASSASSSLSSLAASSVTGSLAAAKTMSSSTLTTLVKIEASSPKVHEMDKTHMNAQAVAGPGGGGCGNVINSSNNTVPIGIAVARKRPQEATAPPPPVPPSLTSSSTLPLSQPLNKDMNCFGIRVADLGGVGTGCGNIYFTGNGELMTSSATADELALANASSLQSVNRAPSTFWQYSNALPIESVISMSPATVGLQYSREASRGQVVLLPATATSLDPFQQAAAAAFVWPSYIPQGTAPATLQQPPNFIFPSMSPHSTLQAAAAAQPYAASLQQLLAPSYLTAAAAAAAAAAATSTLCQHNQQTNSTSSSINLSLGGSVSGSNSGTTLSSSSSSTTTRFMSLSTPGGGGGNSINDTGQSKSAAHKALAPLSVPIPPPSTLALAGGHSLITAAHQHGHSVPPSLLIPPSALKMEEWSSTDFMAAASKTTTTTLTAAALNVPQPPPPPTSAHFDQRDKSSALATTHSATNLLELTAPNTQALNLIRLPTPPSSATMESATAAAAAGTPSHLQTQLLFQATTSSPTPTLLNLSASLNRVTTNQISQSSPNVTTTLPPLAATQSHANAGFMTCSNTNGTTLAATIGPPTPLADDMPPVHYKPSAQHLDTSTSPQIVVGVPRVVNTGLPPLPSSQTQSAAAPPQMQDVNIQTDTPVCSEDENSSCPLNPATTTRTTATPCNGTGNGASNTTNTDHCTSAQFTPPLTQNDELYHDTEAQQPLELTKNISANNSHRPETPLVQSSSQLQVEEQMPLNKNPIKQQQSAPQRHEIYREDKKCEEYIAPQHDHLPMSLTPTITSSTTSSHTNPEDLTGLELLSNISTSTLAKTGTIRVKQEPLDVLNESNMCHSAPSEHHPLMKIKSAQLELHFIEQQSPLMLLSENLPAPPSAQSQSPSTAQHHIMSSRSPVTNIAPSDDVEPLGGLKLLCALAEQRIHEEEEEVQSTNMNGTNVLFRSSIANSPHNFNCNSFTQNAFVKPICSSTATNSFASLEVQNSTFPSLDTLELPSASTSSTSYAPHVPEAGTEVPVKRKKHKHSKHSTKSSTSHNGLSTTTGVSGGSSKKSQKCSKKNKKKYSKEKKRHKLLAETQQTDLAFDDPQMEQELQNAFQNCVDPNYQLKGKWPTPREIISIVKNSISMRLADISRQYRKKKRKLDEISKNKKSKKKCSKHQAANQQISLVGNPALSLAASERSSVSVVGPTPLSSSPLCDYKFGKFSSKSSSSSATTTSSNYLTPSSFIRFATDVNNPQNHHHHLNAHPQFPPPPDLELDNDNPTNNINTSANGTSTTLIYKPVRLEPSSLDQRTTRISHSATGILRLTQKRASSEKHSHVIGCKQAKICNSALSRHSSLNDDADVVGNAEDDEDMAEGNANDNEISNEIHHNLSSSDTDVCKQVSVANPQSCNPIDSSLRFTQDHLYGKETRVLTDMGGLFYAGTMKPLRPPDVYAVTLDGERGNKSHIMSREEICEDAILELAPKTVEDVPVGTRLCAYWSQQYRCLYPGRAIESESSDDGVTSQEFVSVEFDDGDSGRIRLQNIRFLLSDYPLVEYNDNPLYSLGKHKKSGGSKMVSNNESDHHQHSHADYDAEGSTRITKNGSNRDYHQASAMEIFAAKRSEKKRNKSLKRKSEAQINSNSSIAVGAVAGVSSSVVDSGGNNASLESSTDCGRKHHKHKKRKKHKKHRKNLMEIGVVSDKSLYKSSLSTLYNKKNERTTQSAVEQQLHTPKKVNVSHTVAPTEEQHDERIADEELEDDENYDEDNDDNTQIEDTRMATEYNNISLSRIKQESNGILSTTNGPLLNSISGSTNNIKVKTEHLDLEEESTSNLMSEISDEAKADDMVEHNSSKGSKIAAFLPERQLWGWLGTAYCKSGKQGSRGRVRKQFYKTIKRGKETITVGNSAVFLSTGRPDRPYIGRIESMWENSSNNKIVRVRWFYHPEETTGCPNLKYPGALFESPHYDENDVQTISHRCEVLEFNSYFDKFGSDSKQYQSIYDNNDTYYLAGYYNPKSLTLKLQENIPTLEEQKQTLNTTIILNKDLMKARKRTASATHKTNTTTININTNNNSNLNNTNPNTNNN